MSDNLMDTEPGGESGQYEGNLGYIDPVAKQAGQLGGTSAPIPPHPLTPLLLFRLAFLLTPQTTDPATGTQMADQAPKSASTGPNSQGVTPAEKMRYGQTIQESGGGAGRTEDAKGQASSEGGFGGTERMVEEEGDTARQRKVQGYGGDKDMDRNIGG
jgi:hypothetical protein